MSLDASYPYQRKIYFDVWRSRYLSHYPVHDIFLWILDMSWRWPCFRGGLFLAVCTGWGAFADCAFGSLASLTRLVLHRTLSLVQGRGLAAFDTCVTRSIEIIFEIQSSSIVNVCCPLRLYNTVQLFEATICIAFTLRTRQQKSC